MTSLRRLDASRLLQDRSLTRLAVLVVALVVGFSLASPNFLTVLNFQSMGFQVAEIGILSLAMVLSMLTGGIDLSIVSIANICAITTAKMFAATNAADATGSRATMLMLLSVVVGLVAGTLCGVLNGLLVTRMGITPILATLGTLQLLNGVAIIWTGGAALYGFPDSFLYVGSFYVARVPVPVIVLVVAALATAVFVNRTGMGLRLRLVGSNPTAARYSGLNNDRVLMSTYVGSALLASWPGSSSRPGRRAPTPTTVRPMSCSPSSSSSSAGSTRWAGTGPSSASSWRRSPFSSSRAGSTCSG